MNICRISKFGEDEYLWILFYKNLSVGGNSSSLEGILRIVYKECKNNVIIKTDGNNPLDKEGVEYCIKFINKLRKKDLSERL